MSRNPDQVVIIAFFEHSGGLPISLPMPERAVLPIEPMTHVGERRPVARAARAKEKFREPFEVIRSDVLHASNGQNPWGSDNIRGPA